jgi:hypothetical protein
MAKLSDTERHPLRTDPTVPTTAVGGCTHTRAGDEALLWVPRSELAGLAQYLRDSMLLRSVPWPTSPR